MLKLAIMGCSGRMGKALVQGTLDDEAVELVAATVSPGNSLVQTDVGAIVGRDPIGLMPADELAKIKQDIDMLIDFTTPQATLSHVAWCVHQGKPIVIGTTGFSEQQKMQLQTASHDIPILLAPNTSIGVNLSFALIAQAARALGQSADIEIIETHHRHKKDAPSGTALKMGEVICEAQERDLARASVMGRQGNTVRQPGEIGFSSIRAGDIVGEHTVLFSLPGERIEITHRATDRTIYAQGALRAAKWLHAKQPGLYSMQDVLFS